MAGGVHGQRGGILALCRLIERYGDALEYDLLCSGRSLDELGDSLSWRDLQVLVRRWQVTPGFALCDAVQGHELWSTTDQILAELVDELRRNSWLTAGKASAPRPKRTPRPWEKPSTKQFGSDPIPLSQFDDWWESGKSSRR